ncbi:outer membrane protein [Halopseudomonas sp.]|jgi:outer membrane immunogenic protein|uniref:outer membrane protein n=1 Tax=Halopseudomonas sp. TaxID=2901191 RepID=UPI0039E29FE4
MKQLSALAIAVSAAVFSMTATAEGFSGPYVGIYGGKAYATDKGKEFNDGAFEGYRQETKPEQMQYGLLGGYNFDIGNNFVLGLEADYEGRNNDNDTSYQTDNGVIDTGYDVSTGIKAAGSFRGRAGYVFNNPYHMRSPIMLYVTAGYAAAEAERQYRNLNRSPFLEETSTDWQDGWTAGAGAEYLINANFAARLEYRYSDYGSKDIYVDIYDTLEKQDLTEDSVRLGVSYQF